MKTRSVKYLSSIALALMLILTGCDSNDSSGDDDDNGNNDTSGEISYLIEIGAISGGSADLDFSWECFDEEGASTGGSGSGSVSAATNSFSTNLCIGYGLILDAEYTEGSSAVDVRVVAGSAGANEGDVLADETLQGENDSVSIRLGTAPSS